MMQYAKKGLFKANEKGAYSYLPYLGNREAQNKFTLSQLNSALSKLRNVNIKEINDLKNCP